MSVLIAGGEECNFGAVNCVMKLYFSTDGFRFSIAWIDATKDNVIYLLHLKCIYGFVWRCRTEIILLIFQ